MQKTYTPKEGDIEQQWFVVDATGQTLGRLASDIAYILRGKHKAMFTPNLDTGDFVIVVNADKLTVTGKREEKKKYYSHSGYPGGLRTRLYKDVMQTHPERILEKAVRGMLPRTSLGETMYRKLKIYAKPIHPHQGQQPRNLDEALHAATRHAV